MQTQQQKHDMVLEKVYESGAEEWHCDQCGRKFIMQWEPAYRKIVLEVGNEHALHSGKKGAPTPPKVESAPISSAKQIMSDELRELVNDALQNVDFTNFES